MSDTTRLGEGAGRVRQPEQRAPEAGLRMKGPAALAARMASLRQVPVPSEQVLRRVLNLSAAEARLAQGIARGDSLEEIARALDIRMTTARTQLAAIFAKTETRRQARLAVLLAHLAYLNG